MWAAVEPRQQWLDRGHHCDARTIEDLVSDFLVSNDPFPAGTPVFTARWKPGQWGLAQVVTRTDLDEWVVVFIDGSGEASRDHFELSPAL
jgi:hypothetical protein